MWIEMFENKQLSSLQEKYQWKHADANMQMGPLNIVLNKGGLGINKIWLISISLVQWDSSIY